MGDFTPAFHATLVCSVEAVWTICLRLVYQAVPAGAVPEAQRPAQTPTVTFTLPVEDADDGVGAGQDELGVNFVNG